MPQDAYPVDRLIIAIENQSREEMDRETDRLRLELSIKNPIGSLGSSTRYPPGMELRDLEGRIYEPANDDYAEPLQPDTSVVSAVEFRVARDATEFELVFSPGQPEEVHAPLGPVSDGPTAK